MANIRQLSSGNWQAQIRRRGLKPVVKSFKTKVEASRWARLLESAMDRGVFVDCWCAISIDPQLVNFRSAGTA